MSYADEVFKSMCRDIIDNGTDTKGENVRPIWPDTNEKAYTIKKFGVINRYDLRKEFPIMTLRKTALKSAVEEMLWIWQKKSNNVNDLNTRIWDEWADEKGSIGKAYGYQVGKKYVHHKKYVLDDNYYDTANAYNREIRSLEGFPSSFVTSVTDKGKYVIETKMDQTDAILYDLKNNPYSRRIIATMYNLADLQDMNLYPCAYSITLNCTKDKDSDKLILNMILNQRSQDVLTANNWNVVQYAVLLHMLAQVSGMIAGELIHVISDCHIYDRHVELVEELISRKSFPAPKFILNPDITNFYDFTPDDVKLEGYEFGPQISIPVAV